MQDRLVLFLLQAFRVKITQKNHDLLFTILYNFVPAFIFAPYLIYVGITDNLILITIMGICLFIIDTMHFVKAVSIK